MSVSETLNRAADLIEERGWTQGPGGWYALNRYPLCIEGAIYAVLVEEGSEPPTYGATKSEAVNLCPAGQALREYLRLGPMKRISHADGTHSLVGVRLYSWNDARAEDARQVIEALRATAVIEAAKEKEAVPV